MVGATNSLIKIAGGYNHYGNHYTTINKYGTDNTYPYCAEVET